MPIYEFHCKECRSDFKTLRRSDRLEEVACPSCGTDRVARLLSVTARTQNEPSADACERGAACCRLQPTG